MFQAVSVPIISSWKIFDLLLMGVETAWNMRSIDNNKEYSDTSANEDNSFRNHIR